LLRVRRRVGVAQGDTFPEFYDIASDIAQYASRVVFTDKVCTEEKEKDELLALLKEHIFSSIIKFRDKYYIQSEVCRVFERTNMVA